MKLCFVCTAPITAEHFYPGLLRRVLERGHDATLVCGAPFTLPPDLAGRVRQVVIPMTRGPAPVRDLAGLLRMWRFFLRNRFDVVRYSTPKASLLASIGAFLAGQPRRIYMVRGTVYEPEDPGAWLYDRLDGLTSLLSNVVVPVGRDLARQMVSSGRAPGGRIVFLGHGSSMGVDLERFSRTPEVEARAQGIRASLGVGPGDLMILTLARLARGKGINYAIEAFLQVAREIPHAHLVVAGPIDDREPIEAALLETMDANLRIHRPGRVGDTPAWHAAADINLFPTLREGFPNVVMEAGAMGIPVITFDVDGGREPIVDGVTGLLVPPRDPEALANALRRLASDSDARKAMGAAAREHVAAHFDTRYVLGEAVRLIEAVGEGRERDPSFVRPWARGMLAPSPRSSS